MCWDTQGSANITTIPFSQPGFPFHSLSISTRVSFSRWLGFNIISLSCKVNPLPRVGAQLAQWQCTGEIKQMTVLHFLSWWKIQSKHNDLMKFSTHTANISVKTLLTIRPHYWPRNNFHWIKTKGSCKAATQNGRLAATSHNHRGTQAYLERNLPRPEENSPTKNVRKWCHHWNNLRTTKVSLN